MKVPMPPPPMGELLEEMERDPYLFGEIATGLRSFDATSDYLPWDKLRFKTPPRGLTHRQWWFALKIVRSAMQRTLPLSDADGRPFTYALPDTVLRASDEISRRASGQILMSEQVTNPATRDRYIVSSLVEEAITSSQLEGAATSRQVAKEMIRSGRPPRDKSERMILNNYNAMRFVGSIRDRELTPELLCEVHRIVTEETLDNPTEAGRIQSDPDPSARVAVFGDGNQIIHRPPPVETLQGRLQSLCNFANSTKTSPYLPPLLRAVTIHFMVGYDHYFEDGNGRTARALFYWSMLREGYWLTEFLTISRILKQAPSKYARSFILSEQDDGDLTYFFIYHLDVISRAISELDSYLARKVRELRTTRVLLASTPGEYNHRQLALLELALKDPSCHFTVVSHSTSHNVSPETARQDLSNLAERGLLDQRREGKRFVWQPINQLAEKIASARGL
jgi:Fic family protein